MPRRCAVARGVRVRAKKDCSHNFKLNLTLGLWRKQERSHRAGHSPGYPDPQKLITDDASAVRRVQRSLALTRPGFRGFPTLW